MQFALDMAQEAQRQCPSGGGSGELPARLCPLCSGKRVFYGVSTVTLKLEPGIEEGHVLRLEMESVEVPNRLPGELLVEVRTHAHPVFSRRRS
ncbi:putative chaperone protein DNAj [Leptomonas seymouri]|uniref:Putative chaperone protein DNAj n=1 Tax=Leptomonas seymouri TaxID=5684 RepID=A0A0N0P3U9_LEPSE|nr:putative chaperone protein DNAj [Leptomonas seymouri]|eukprot:KPI84556.1 putative chaperone protein DNAj [Leptomonas seymouri]